MIFTREYLLTVPPPARAGAAGSKIFDPDTRGLHLAVSVAGGRVWRLKISHKGREQCLTGKALLDCDVPEARAWAVAMRDRIVNGRTRSAPRPGPHQSFNTPAPEVVVRREQAKAASADPTLVTFGTVAREWFERERHAWKPRTVKKQEFFLDLLSDLRDVPLADLAVTHVDSIVNGLKQAGQWETVGRVINTGSRIMRGATRRGQARFNPFDGAVEEVREPTGSRSNHPAVTDVPNFSKLLRALWTFVPGSKIAGQDSRLALTFMALSGLRGHEVRNFTYAMVDRPAKVLHLPAEIMSKRGVAHDCPLTDEMLELIDAANLGLNTDPNARVFDVSDTALAKALRRATAVAGEGVPRSTPHGLRASFTTISRGHLDPELVELQLHHVVAGVRREYLRGGAAVALEERRAMLAKWAEMVKRMREQG